MNVRGGKFKNLPDMRYHNVREILEERELTEVLATEQLVTRVKKTNVVRD